MLEVEIIVPRYDNDGFLLTEERDRCRRSLCEAFGGISTPFGHVSGGYIMADGSTVEDISDLWRVAVPSISALYREVYVMCAVLRQENMMVRFPAWGYAELIGNV